MATRLIVFCLLMAMTFACIDEDSPNKRAGNGEQESDTLKSDTTFQYCDSVAVANSPGTSCCVSGKKVAKPGEIFKYHYQTNRPNREIYWVVLEGDIEIISGQDTHTVTVEFGPNFSSGTLQGKAKGDPIDNTPTILCEDVISISSK